MDMMHILIYQRKHLYIYLDKMELIGVQEMQLGNLLMKTIVKEITAIIIILKR